MNEHLVKFWLFATHWTELDTFDTEEDLNDEIELLHRQNLPTKVRQRTKKDGGEELVLYAVLSLILELGGGLLHRHLGD